MKIVLIINSLLLLFTSTLHSEEDSLLVKWKNTKFDDSTRTIALNQYIWNNHINNKSDSADYYIEIYDKFNQTISKRASEYGQINILMMKGVIELKQGKYETALDYFNQSLKLSQKPKHKFYIARSNFFLAVTYYYMGDYSKSLKKYESVLALYKELNKPIDIAATYLNIGSVYRELTNHNKTLEYYHKALEIYEQEKMEQEISAIYNNLGLIYKEYGEYVNAIKFYDKSVEIKEKLGDKLGKAATLHNIGLIYIEFEDYHKALDYINKSIDIEKYEQNSRGLANSYTEKGIILISLKEYDDALSFLNKSLEINEKIGAKSGSAYSLMNIGLVYSNLQNHEKAIEYYLKSLEYFEETEELNGISSCLSYLGMEYIKVGKIEKALKYCTESEKLSMQIEDYGTQKQACECLYEVYKKKNDTRKALSYFEKSSEFADKLNIYKAAIDIQKIEFQKTLLADSLKQEERRLTTKLQYENKIAEENQQRNIALAIGALLIIAVGGLYNRNRYINRTNKEITTEKNRSEELLLNILPEEVAKELKIYGKAEARDFDNVTIMFTDFKEFTQASEKLTAKDLVSELNYCFEKFDNICSIYKIEKIKTIGDSYMVAGGIPIQSPDSTKRTILAGFEMQDFLTERRNEMVSKGKIVFEMRIGIHTGSVVAGIVGVKKFQYDVWGDTVNTASRMESAGEVGKVNISHSTYELLKDDPDFVFEHRGKVQAKGKGEVDMYFVERATLLQ